MNTESGRDMSGDGNPQIESPNATHGELVRDNSINGYFKDVVCDAVAQVAFVAVIIRGAAGTERFEKVIDYLDTHSTAAKASTPIDRQT